MVYIVRCNNSAVTDFYLNIIGEIFSDCHELVKNYSSDDELGKNDILIVATTVDFVRMYMRGFKKIVFWMQGIESEESYLKHRSKARKIVLDGMTKLALKKSIAVFFVSETMRKFEEKKFKIDIKNKSFIMPCFNVSQNSVIHFNDNKYENNIFAYVGSLSEWQCFPETIDFYKKIERLVPNASLRVFTFQKEEAEKILLEKKVKNFSVNTVAPDKMTEALADVKFGFVLRDNISVNNVATPTKLSSYLSAGVIPIFSECIRDFFENTRDMHYVIPVNNKKKLPENLKMMINEKICCENVEKEYSQLFSTYYNPDYYKQQFHLQIVELLRWVNER